MKTRSVYAAVFFMTAPSLCLAQTAATQLNRAEQSGQAAALAPDPTTAKVLSSQPMDGGALSPVPAAASGKETFSLKLGAAKTGAKTSQVPRAGSSQSAYADALDRRDKREKVEAGLFVAGVGVLALTVPASVPIIGWAGLATGLFGLTVGHAELEKAGVVTCLAVLALGALLLTVPPVGVMATISAGAALAGYVLWDVSSERKNQ